MLKQGGIMAKVKNLTMRGCDKKPITFDIFFNESLMPQPVIIYAHGFNGFKDWGNFDLIADQFLASGFAFIKFNFSYNGTSPEQPEHFVDLAAFGENNYTRQLDDLKCIIDWIYNPFNPYRSALAIDKIGLIGHSMGGGISIIKTAEDRRIKSLITWAAIDQCKTPWRNWSREQLKEWKHEGVAYYINGRTRQQMPLNYQLYEDFLTNQEHLDILKAANQIKVPWLICHGTEDINVPVTQAYNLKKGNANAALFTISTDHVFGRRHPWNSITQPFAMQEVLNRNILFFKQHLGTQ